MGLLSTLNDKLQAFAANPREVATDNLGKSLVVSAATVAVAAGLLFSFTALPLVIGAVAGLAGVEIVIPVYGALANAAAAVVDKLTPEGAATPSSSRHSADSGAAPSKLARLSSKAAFNNGQTPDAQATGKAPAATPKHEKPGV